MANARPAPGFEHPTPRLFRLGCPRSGTCRSIHRSTWTRSVRDHDGYPRSLLQGRADRRAHAWCQGGHVKRIACWPCSFCRAPCLVPCRTSRTTADGDDRAYRGAANAEPPRLGSVYAAGADGALRRAGHEHSGHEGLSDPLDEGVRPGRRDNQIARDSEHVVSSGVHQQAGHRVRRHAPGRGGQAVARRRRQPLSEIVEGSGQRVHPRQSRDAACAAEPHVRHRRRIRLSWIRSFVRAADAWCRS